MDIVLDFGNAWLKYYVPRTGEKGRVRHALAEVSPEKFKQLSRDGVPLHDGYYTIASSHYAVGDRARRHIIKDKPRGAARYQRDYYGVGLCAVLATVAPQGSSNVRLLASYAPGDWMHAGKLIESAQRTWTVAHAKADTPVQYTVTAVETFDEPFGGWANRVFTKDGLMQANSEALLSQITYVLDIGGHTVDGVAIDPNGEIDFSSAQSTRTGVQHIMRLFEEELRSAYSEEFQNTPDIDDRKIEHALTTGFFTYGKRQLDCSAAANGLKTRLVNDVKDIFEAAGGVANYDIVVLTGGGAAMLYSRLEDAMPDVNFVLAHQPHEIQYANVLGGWKLYQMIRQVNDNGE